MTKAKTKTDEAKTKVKGSEITSAEIRDMAISAGFTVREQPDGEMDLNPYVYDFARSLIKRARGLTPQAQPTAKCVLVVRVDRRTGATLEYDVSDAPVDAANRWQKDMCLDSGMDLLEEIVETPPMVARVLVNNLDDNHSYLMVRGSDLPAMGAAINALIDKRWPGMDSSTTLLTREDMELLSSQVDIEGHSQT